MEAFSENLGSTRVAASSEIDAALASIPSARESAAARAEGAARDDYRVVLPCFEGPLDLLLHLIRKDQLNIYDIPVSKICRSYLDYLEHLKQIDFNIAGEFMVMAATLTHLKSILILPNENADNPEDDPRRPLVAQLLEYEKFKAASLKIDSAIWLGRDVYPRPTTAASDIPVESLLDAPIDPVDTYQMLLCLKVALDRTHRPPIQITTDPISLKEKVAQISSLLEFDPVIEFASLLPADCQAIDVVVSFLSMLELAKLKFVEVIQTENFGPIHIRAVKPLRELNEGLLDQY